MVPLEPLQIITEIEIGSIWNLKSRTFGKYKIHCKLYIYSTMGKIQDSVEKTARLRVLQASGYNLSYK